MEWNLLVTAHRFQAREARQQLKELAGVELRPTPFRDVLVGKVDNPDKLFQSLAEATGVSGVPGAPVFLPAFSRLVPLQESFSFKPEELLSELQKRVEKYSGWIPTGASFAVFVERRGLKGTLNSAQMERSLAEHLWRTLEGQGKKPKVDLENPDFSVAVEILGTECGLGLIPKELRERFPFVKPD